MSERQSWAGYEGPPQLRTTNNRPLPADALLRELIYEVRALRAEIATPRFDDQVIHERIMADIQALDAPLPEDFPGFDALLTAGITTFGEVPYEKSELTAINGIGPATADRILEELP